VALLDTEGQPVVSAAFQSVAPRNDSFGAHEIVSAEDVAQLAGHVSVEAVLREGSAVGTIFVAGTRMCRMWCWQFATRACPTRIPASS